MNVPSASSSANAPMSTTPNCRDARLRGATAEVGSALLVGASATAWSVAESPIPVAAVSSVATLDMVSSRTQR